MGRRLWIFTVDRITGNNKFANIYLSILYMKLFSIALTEDGGVYSCGWGADGQTGLGHYRNIWKFTRLQGDIAAERIVQVAGRCDFVVAVNGTYII